VCFRWKEDGTAGGTCITTNMREPVHQLSTFDGNIDVVDMKRTRANIRLKIHEDPFCATDAVPLPVRRPHFIVPRHRRKAAWT
jgi:hypothetical protein